MWRFKMNGKGLTRGMRERMINGDEDGARVGAVLYPICLDVRTRPKNTRAREDHRIAQDFAKIARSATSRHS